MYTASKAALRSMSAGMRMELGKYGVDVIMFNPGDHPGETPLCAGQDIHYAAMEREVNHSCSSRFALSSNPLSTRVFIKVNAISDADKVLKHFESYRAKFSALFPMPSLKKLNNPGYYKVCKYLRNPFSTKVWG